MALSTSTIEATIKAALDAEYGVPADPVQQAKFVTALANALFTILTTQATISVVSVSGVTPGGGASGPGVGTII